MEQQKLASPGIAIGPQKVAALIAVPGRNSLLGSLSHADHSALSPYLKDCALEKGQVLHEPGEPVEFIYFPHSGMISLLAVMGDGHSVEVGAVGRETGVGLTAALGAKIALHRAVVQLPGSAARIAASRFSAALEQHETLRIRAVQHNAALLIQVQQLAACNLLHDVESRLCKWLLQTRERVGCDTLPLTHEFLAQMLGVRRSTVTLVARILQANGVIHYRRGQITIRDPRALEDGACECYRVVSRQNDQLLNSAEPQAYASDHLLR
jgi:CRP-like cAMP-binding protein